MIHNSDPKITDKYIKILTTFSDREKLRIIYALSESMLNPAAEPSEEAKEVSQESDEEFWSHFSAWKEDGETYEETVAKICNAR